MTTAEWKRLQVLRGTAPKLPPEVDDPDDIAARKERMLQIIEMRKQHFQQMTEKWKAGLFDHLYGRYAARGVVLHPPPKVYMEMPACAAKRQEKSKARP